MQFIEGLQDIFPNKDKLIIKKKKFRLQFSGLYSCTSKLLVNDFLILGNLCCIKSLKYIFQKQPFSPTVFYSRTLVLKVTSNKLNCNPFICKILFYHFIVFQSFFYSVSISIKILSQQLQPTIDPSHSGSSFLVSLSSILPYFPLFCNLTINAYSSFCFPNIVVFSLISSTTFTFYFQGIYKAYIFTSYLQVTYTI